MLSKAVALLGEPDPRRPGRAGDVLVAVEDDLRGERRVPGHLDRHMTPLGVHDVEAVVVDVRRLLRDVADHPGGLRAADLPHARRRLRGQDQEHPRPGRRVRGQVLLGDQVLALPGLAVDHRDAVGLAPRLDPAGEPARHPHQVRVVQLLVGAVVQPPPPGPEPARVVPQREDRRSARSGPRSHSCRSADPRTARRSHQPRTERARLIAARQPNCPKGHSFRAKSRTERSDPWSLASGRLCQVFTRPG